MVSTRSLPFSTPPPRTRGSTLAKVDDLVDAGASPAYAGIDLQIRHHDTRRGRLPRVRGDRPQAHGPEFRALMPPPRTRGSTLRFLT